MKKVILVIFLMFISYASYADADADFKEAMGYIVSRSSTSTDYKKAFEIGERLIQKGDCRGEYIHASLYSSGFDVKKDIYYAESLYIKSANSGCAMSMSHIANMYFYDRDYIKAIQWFSKTYETDVKNNDKKKPHACYAANKIAELYYNEKKYSDSLHWYQNAKILKDCINNVVFARIQELESAEKNQAVLMREDPPVAGIRLSLGGESKSSVKPKKKSKKKN